MDLHKVEYVIPLTGSKLFDMVMRSTAEKLCADFPGLNYDYDGMSIRVYGELDDYWYGLYQKEMFGKDGDEAENP
ncbi:MAG: hypothetical protein ACI4O5_05865 [Oscillospiraceae bacterium]